MNRPAVEAPPRRSPAPHTRPPSQRAWCSDHSGSLGHPTAASTPPARRSGSPDRMRPDEGPGIELLDSFSHGQPLYPATPSPARRGRVIELVADVLELLPAPFGARSAPA